MLLLNKRINLIIFSFTLLLFVGFVSQPSYVFADENLNTADEWLDYARREPNSSSQLTAYIQGYNLYPEDTRFTDGINDRAKSLLNYASNQHQLGHFQSAISRYNLILSAPSLHESIKYEASLKKELAEQEKKFPNADDLVRTARNQSNSSAQLTAYIEGYYYYPRDSRFKDGINDRATSLINFARGQHEAGNFASALIRYDLILSAPVLDENIKNEVVSLREFAVQGKQYKTADQQFNFARNEPNSSAQLTAYIKGYEMFPHDKRFEDGINDRASSLFNFASGQHQIGNYGSAILRYNLILSAPVLNKTIKNEVEKNLQYALEGKRTADLQYLFAKNEPNSSAQLTAHIKGYEMYPEDGRFEDGINDRAQSLLNFASRQHESGNFGSAILRYELILSAPILDSQIRREVETKLDFANRNRTYPSADDQFDFAKNEPNSSAQLVAYIEGYEMYPHDQRFEDGINDRARSLLNYATNQHELGNLTSANMRYELILSSPVLDKFIKQEAELKKSFADRNKSIPTANEMFNTARNEQTSSAQLTAYIQGHVIYPEDQRFVEGINDRAQSLLRWASEQQQDGNFSTAVNRYNLILTAPVLDPGIKYEAEIKLEYALQQKKIPTANDLYNLAVAGPNSSAQLTTYITGYVLYPDDSRFEEGINDRARSLLNFASNQHLLGNYGSALLRYELILSSPVLDDRLRLETEAKKAFANDRKIYRTAEEQLIYAEKQPNSSAQLSAYIDGYILYPSDERFISGINDRAHSLLNYANNQHRAGNFSTAIHRYNLILDSYGVDESIKENVRVYLRLAVDGDILGSEIVQYTTYNVTLSQAINTQLGLNPPPQTDKYRNTPVYIHSSLLDIIEKGVVSSGVNVRTSPSTGGNNIDFTTTSTITVTIEEEVEGSSVSGDTKWYKIKHNNKTLYVHNSVINVSDVAIVKSTANIRQSASSSSHSFGTVSSGTEMRVLSKRTGTSVGGNNVWYQLDFNRTWRNATIDDFKAYLDPNNHDIFQHLVLSSSVGVPSTELNKLLSGKGILHGTGQAFIDAGREHSVNEVYLISHALLETEHGRSTLATGVEVGRNSSGNAVRVTSSNRSNLTNIRTVYNMFGIGAYDNTAVTSGAIYAYNQGWFTPEAAIIGGAKFIGEDYIHNRDKQNTLYKMRWNPARPGVKQYATDMGWAVKQVSTIKNFYNQLDNPVLHFDIPVYR
ncbi:N-acetylglucosaminidase [Evansella cellulosilytica]|uniref:Mannosyl-glycoprotein endo-beta-N-acetylglucosaminidase n=1 Tax=Evansella cellulosilytica (strain ATCC 21833 / DSM 2522 / FERM P-1141 / JCM 9156 / N-4) TaxID=649639 RepID=E6TSB3_EVAC2|nr:N-acetylglucosaminidase [Evansella cellulosilytica]ADU31882.1 Mannosyl-glycoprotein endo-beta-N-acetylglucosaminidase [Evansella cellulosilytica DSM 2522]